MKRINVTKSFLPPIEEYQEYLQRIWKKDWLTNHGPLLQEFEEKLESYLHAENLHFVTNGTLGLQIVLRSLGITEGEVITTPFTYVATTSSILWERCTPVFADIDPKTLCIDPRKIEALITENTKAIMPVHVFGNPCDIEAIDAIAKKHNLPVIYDAAHGFGVEYKGKSLLDYGDVSMCSLHATKLFHTIEGGLVIARDKSISAKIELTKRFGHNGDVHHRLGMNAKASEFQAAMGLCNLKYVDEQIKGRKKVSAQYDALLQGSKFERPTIRKGTKYNYIYYPVLLRTEEELLNKVDQLKELNIHPRRYFYPSLNTIKYVGSDQKCPVSEDISKRILCLPLYADLEEEKVNEICEVLNK
ncbi:MAG TPA: DegT/DnrJ/EryC1/StrS family aminotransferase [Candidatus Saccharimonadales bacterium]|nr:DegT/DnrJ/EryC1/StrS family aminotransferase [Candidatus Saccharimonadales bacterium]